MPDITKQQVKMKIEVMVDEFRKQILRELDKLRTSGETTADADAWIKDAKEQLSKPFPFETEDR